MKKGVNDIIFVIMIMKSMKLLNMAILKWFNGKHAFVRSLAKSAESAKNLGETFLNPI